MVTVEKVRQLFAHGELAGQQSVWTAACDFGTFGHNIRWRNKSVYFNKWENVHEHRNPPHIVWNNNAVFSYIGLVNGALEFKYGCKGESVYSFCAAAVNAEIISEIKEVFDTWFDEIVKLPHFDCSKHKSDEQQKEKAVNRLNSIRAWLKLDDGSEKNKYAGKFHLDKCLLNLKDILLYVDWDAYDDEIVANCERIIQTGCLSSKIVNICRNKYELTINYKGRNHRLFYPYNGSEREITLFALNNAIMDDYEIRFCNDSAGSDTLAFLVLPTEDWNTLEEEFKGKLVDHFEPLYRCTLSFTAHHYRYPKE